MSGKGTMSDGNVNTRRMNRRAVGSASSARTVVLPRHEQIADDLRSGIADGLHPAGSTLPSESALALRYQVARGTVRQALQTLATEGVIAVRQGARRVVLDIAPAQSFSELLSFAEWARSIGRSPGGHFVVREWRLPDPEVSLALQVPADEPVLHTVRLRTLDERPVFVERCRYVSRVAASVLAMDPDCPSVTAAMHEQLGIVVASGSHLIDLAEADEQDAALLAINAGDPVLRRRGVTRQSDGVPIDYTVDHYVKGSVTFSLQNSVQNNSLSRMITAH
jgi:GntR family transcriptional regulator